MEATPQPQPVPLLKEPLAAAGDKPRPLSAEQLMRMRTWVEVDLAALAANVRVIQERVHPARLLIVIKKDAYGHGLLPVARALEEIGVRYLGVACAGEGVVLRGAGIKTPILNLGVALADEIESAIANDIDLTVATLAETEQAAKAARRLGRPARLHLKIDTGMGRLGLFPEQLLEQVDAMAALPNVEWVGLYSHLADCPGNAALTNRQFELFQTVAEAMSGWLPLRHLGASGAIGDRRLHLDLLRVGIAVYGGDPNQHECAAVMSMKSRLVFLKDFPAGRTIGYGATYTTSAPTRVGVVAAGYGNGYPRLISNRGHVLIGGRPAAIVGRICMDHLMVNLNDHPGARVGDTVLLFGQGGEAVLPVWLVASWAETISYELLCTAGMMNPRVCLRSAGSGGKSNVAGPY